MADESLFSYLKKYTPTEKRNAREDYLTQLFAWILEEFSDVKKEYVKFLIEKLDYKDKNIILNSTHEITVETQKRVSNGIIDLFIQIENNTAFVCEHKVYSDLMDDQIKKYMDCKEEYSVENLYSVLITYSKEQHSQKADISLTWKDIYNFFKEKFDVSRVNDNAMKYEERLTLFFVGQIMEYLQEEGMVEENLINKAALENWYYMKALEKNLRAVFNKLQKDGNYWKEVCPALMKFDNPNELKPECHKLMWGRIGIDFYEQWNMGLFAGVILDPKDHRIYPENIENGPDFVIIIDCEKEKRKMYAESDFIKKLKKKFKNYTGEYTFISDLANEWRLAVIKRPLLDIISTANDEDEQEKAIKDEIIKGINLMLDVE